MARKKVKNILLILFLILISLFSFSGCTTDYDQDDIAEYVHETYGLRKFTVSRKAAEIIDYYTSYSCPSIISR